MWVILKVLNIDIWRNSKFESVKIPKFSLSHTQILHKFKFDDFRKSKYAILVILEALNLDFRTNSTLESVKYYQNL